MSDKNRCSYCRVGLDEHGVIANRGDVHAPDCADRPFEKYEIDRLFAQRKRRLTVYAGKGREVIDAPLVSIGHHLLTVLDHHEVRTPVEYLLEELAALCDMTDANRPVPTDAGRRGPRGSGVPSFNPAAAARELVAAANRLHSEAEKLSGVIRNPHRSPEPQCVSCGRRSSEVDSFCRPCGARILKEHRRVEPDN